MAKVLLFLVDGFEETEAVATIDILRRGGVLVQSVSLGDDHFVKGSHGMILKADAMFWQVVADAGVDMLVLPGGPGTKHYLNHEGFVLYLKECVKAGKILAAICAAPTVFGELGFLEGKDAVCYPGCEQKLYGARVKKDTVVADGNIITAKGPGSAVAFGLVLVARLMGNDVSYDVAKDFVADI